MPDDAISIERGTSAGLTTEEQVDWFYQSWFHYKQATHEYEQTTLNRNDPTQSVSDESIRYDADLAVAIPILHRTALAALDRVEQLPETALDQLDLEERLKLRLALVQIRKEVEREKRLAERQAELAELQNDPQEREHGNDERSR